jgi:hypothetical protein
MVEEFREKYGTKDVAPDWAATVIPVATGQEV